MSLRGNKLDLNLLVSLRELLATKSVTRAGEVMNLTQPTMSGILARLRDYFDDPLIVPVARKMELTPLAHSLVDPLNDLLIRVEATLNARPEFNPQTSQRHFTIIASDYVVTVLLSSVLRRVRAEGKHLKIEIIQPNDRTAELLEEGEVDFIITPQILISDKHPSVTLFEDSYRIVVDRDNEQVGDTISLDDYFSFGHVLFRSHGTATWENWFEGKHGDMRQVEVMAQTFSLLPHLVVGTDRIATMHMRLAQQFASMLPIRLVKPLFDIPRLAEALQWHPNRTLDPGNVWLREQIIDAARSLPAVLPHIHMPSRSALATG